MSRLSAELRRRRINAVHARTIAEMPLYASAIIISDGSGKSVVRSKVVHVEDYTDIKSVVDKALQLARGIMEPKELTVAIDPGKRLGMALFCDDLLIRTETVSDKAKVLDEILSFFANSEDKSKRIVIGKGGTDSARLVNYLRLKLADLPMVHIETVDESFSSRGISPYFARVKRDEYSAVLISTRKRRVRRF